MFLTIVRLEVATALRRGTTYLYAAVLFLLAAYAMASDAVQPHLGAVARNAPWTIAQILIGLTIVGQVITTAVVGAAILRDVQYRTHELLFTTRVTRVGYLGGRFVGSLLVMLAIYAALPLGMFVGTRMPWLDPHALQAFRLSSYTLPVCLIVIPNVVFVSALMFAVGALTRNQVAIYTQGIGLLAAYAVGQTVLVNLDQLWLAAMLDPFGDAAFGLLTRYWTVVERNTRALPLSGPLLANRLIWLGVAAALVLVTLATVRLEAQPRPLGRPRRRDAVPAPSARRVVAPAALPAGSISFGPMARVRQLASQTRFFFVAIVREPVFLTIACIGLVYMGLGAWYADLRYGTALWPVTGEMLAAIIRRMYLFLVVLCTVYAGELVWRERDLRVAGTTDALPVPSWIPLAGKFLAFLGAMLAVEMTAVLATLCVQTLKGYHQYQLGLYARGVLGIAMPTVFEVGALAFAVHAVVNEKFVGHLIMIVYFLVTLALNNLGFQRVIYHYGFTPEYVYSDMNGFRQYAASLSGLALYFSAAGLGLLIVTYLAWPRGADETWRARAAAARARWRPGATRALAGGTVLATLAFGGSVWRNTAVINRYASTRDVERARAAYERDFRRYRSIAGPRIVHIHVHADLVPEQRAMALSSVYTVVNKHARPIDTLYASLASSAFHFRLPDGMSEEHDYHVDSLSWGRPTELLFADSTRGVYLYRLRKPLAPGDSTTLAFGAHYAARGYPNDSPNNDLVANGTFLNSTLTYFPSLCYQADVELRAEDERRREHLPLRPAAAPLDDESARANNGAACDADWVTFDAVVSTAPDQIAIAPGTLQREWIAHGRRFFAYRTDRPIPALFSIQSGRYLVRQDSAQGVNLAVYYHPGHDVDVGRIIEGAKRGLAYYDAHFSPYQFKEFRVVEFPRYQSFAEAFPGTVPFSEGLGFISRVRDADNDIDWPLFATAHELAHEWWGEQITPADQEGAAMLTESLAEYSALTIMEQKYGVTNLRKFLRYELDRYLDGRSTAQQPEVPLMRVAEVSQLYIAYSKGSLAFYALRDYIGEDSLNAALRRFLRDKAFQQPPYTDTPEMITYLHAVTPESLQYVIRDLFETITLYDNRATAASATPRADGRYDVRLTFTARKLRADSLGAERPIPIADYIDVGVFAGDRPLAVRKVHVTQPVTTVDFVVGDRPTRAGVDPFNKLIDRAPEDNVIGVTTTPPSR